MDNQTEQNKKRGWIFDQLMIVGSLEAGMNHHDEEICNIYNQLDYAEDQEAIQGLADKLSAHREILAEDYTNRVNALNQIFDEFPDADRHLYCSLKHHAATYVMAAENYHARHEDEGSEAVLVKSGETLALVCSLAFGFEPMDCLRCISDSLASKLGINVDTTSEKNNDKTISL